MDDERLFQYQAVDQPRSVICPHCQATVDLPKTEPHLVVNGVFYSPARLMSLLCSSCKERIYLQDASDEDRAIDKAADQAREADEDERDQ